MLVENSNDLDKFLTDLESSVGNFKKQLKPLEQLVERDDLFEKYLKHSGTCQELFELLDETLEEINESNRSKQQFNINETNADLVLICLEKACIYYQNKLKKNPTDSKLILDDKLDIRTKFSDLCSKLADKYVKLITRCLKLRSGTKKTIELQETCVRLLTICVNQSVEYAKKIALEFDYFNEFKNWLERFLLMRQTYLREYSVQFIVSFFKYIKTVSSSSASDDALMFTVDREYLVVLKKIFLTETAPPPVQRDSAKKGAKKAKVDQTPTTSLVNCLFSHIGTDSLDTIEFTLQEILFKLVQNESFNKNEKVKFFNERVLSSLVKLFEWRDKSKEKAKPDEQTLNARRMITEFLKVLFCSTKFGINFYDKTLNIDQSTKNQNHLIFNALLSIQRPSAPQQNEIDSKTNELIDDLLLRTFKVCPDLVQRFLKVKQKQEATDDWLVKFSTRLFENQLLVIKSMKKSQISSTSFLRSMAASGDDPAGFLCDLIISTSLPLCVSYQKVFNNTNQFGTHYNEYLLLLSASLRCLREWKECLKYYESTQLELTDLSHHKINELLKKILKSGTFNSKLNLELLNKYLPKFDQLCDSQLMSQILDDNLESDTQMIIVNSFEIFNLYFDLFMTHESSELIGNSFNLLQIETLDQRLASLIPALLSLSTDELAKSKSTSHDESNSHLVVCLKYLKFLIKYSVLKQNEQYLESSAASSNLFTEVKSNKDSYSITYDNLTILNLVKIVFKFRNAFKLIVNSYLKLSCVYLEDSYSDYTNSIYLWLLLIKKHFADQLETLKSDELNLYLDYIYLCLNTLFSAKHRNYIQFQLNDSQMSFNQLFVYICLKRYSQFSDLIQANEMKTLETPLVKLKSFLFDYVLSSSLMYENSRTKGLNECFDAYFKQVDKMDQFKKELNAKLAKVVSASKCERSEAFMIIFEECSHFNSDKSFAIVDLNLNLRISHLLFLLKLIINKDANMTEKDLDLVVTNLKSCLDTKHKIHSLDEETVQKMEPETTKVKNINELLEIEEALAIEKQNFNEYFDHVKSIISDFNLDETSLIRMKLNTHLVAEFDMNKQDFMSSIDHFLSSDLSSSEQFVYFSKILIRNQAYLFESDMNLFREFDLDLDYLNNLDLLSKCVKLLLGYLNTFDYKKLKVDDETLKEKLAQFLKQAYAYKPVLFKLLVQLTSPDSLNKNLKKFASSNNDLLSVFESCYQEDSSSLDNLTPNEEEFLKLYSTNNKNYASLNVDQLLEVYTFSLSVKDQLILKRLHELDSNLNCLHYNSKLTEFISLRMNQDTSMISTSILNYPINRKLDDLSVQLDKEVTLDTIVLDELSLVNAKIFDPIYVLPNLYHLLDYENNVDVVQFVQSKCLSYLLASLSSECKHLRSLSYACIYRFVAHLEKNKSYFKNIIVHLISLLKNSIKIENLKLPTVISVFLAEAVMVVIEPGTNLYKPIVSFLILKPTLDFTNVPEFYKLFNSSSLQYKLERKWMLNILVTSCRTSLDYRLFEKRFVYRQLMSIYDSKMSDLDTKLSILNLIYRTCQCKFALIDLIKRHYLLIWLTSVLENCLTKSNQQTEINIFYKLIKIYVLIWHQLGSSRTVNNEVHTPPLAFLNQMFILMKLLLVKLVDHHSKINELKYEFKSDETKSLNLGRIVIRNFFKVKRELTHSLKSFNLNLVKLEESDNLDNEFKCLSKKECTFEDVQEKISARKRVCSIDLNTTNNNNKKIRTF